MSSFVILLSGHGSTLQALIDAEMAGLLPADCLKGVISNVSSAYGLKRAEQAVLPIKVVSHQDYPTKEAFEADLLSAVFAFHPKPIVVLAGFMRILSPAFIDALEGRILNIHPSLLPKYKGLETYQAALAAKEPFHGTTVHLVDASLDGGPILAQARVSIVENDTIESLKARVQEKERWLYPRILKLFTEGHLRIENRQPLFCNRPIDATGLPESTYAAF